MKSTLQPLTTLALAMFFLFAPSTSAQSFHHTFYDVPGFPSDVFVSDLNHDGKPDLLTGQSESNAFTVFLNHGNGTFTNNGSLSFIVTGRNVNRVVAADFNGDGNIDVATQPVPSSMSLLSPCSSAMAMGPLHATGNILQASASIAKKIPWA